MKIDVTFSATNLDELQLRDKNVVVIDVLRSSTTVVTALANGAREIIPVSNIESAVKISASLLGDVTVRGGERNGKMIQGFNLGNSPLEYTEAAVKGKSIIYCTTNGSVAMNKCRHARNMVVAAFINISKVAEFITQVNDEFLIICAGNATVSHGFSMEDAVCAGMIIHKVQDERQQQLELTDTSIAALSLYRTHGRSILKMLRNTDHGKYLASIGFDEDLKACAKVDSVPALPMLMGTSVKLLKEDQRAPDAELPAVATPNS
jgi:2-phosphosulfolactate phosphatase